MSRSLGAVLLAFSALAWSFSGVLLKLPTADTPAAMVLGLRSAVVALALGIVAGRSGLHLSRKGYLGAVLSLISASCFVLAIRTGSVVIATTLYYSAPVFAALIEWGVVGRKLSALEWMSAGAAAVGVALIAGGLDGATTLSLIFAVTSGAAAAGCYTVFSDLKEGERTGAFAIAMFAIAALCAVLLMVKAPAIAVLTPWNIGWSVANGFVATLALFLTSKGMNAKLSPTSVAIIQATEVPLNAVWPLLADALFGTAIMVPLTPVTWIGCGVVFAAALLVTLGEQKK